VKFVNTRPVVDPEVAALKIVDPANAVEPYFDNRILIEKINGPFLYELRARRRNTRPASTARSKRAGWCCIRAGRS
jgi:hypothetical protein